MTNEVLNMSIVEEKEIEHQIDLSAHNVISDNDSFFNLDE
jgi:hypothetical protein